MPFVAPIAAVASVGLGVMGMAAQSKAANQQRAAQALDRESARQATLLEYEKLDIDIAARARSAGVTLGAASAAIAGAGAEVGGAISAQARAVTLTALARDIEVLQLNADIAATRLGFGPETGGPEGPEALERSNALAGKRVKQKKAAEFLQDSGVFI